MADKKRCKWCESNDYHDTEWGVPVYDDQKLFELLILEGAQAGVSWHVVLQKRAHYKKIFADFDIDKCAKLTDKKLEKAQCRKNSTPLRNTSGASSTVNQFKTNAKT